MSLCVTPLACTTCSYLPTPSKLLPGADSRECREADFHIMRSTKQNWSQRTNAWIADTLGLTLSSLM